MKNLKAYFNCNSLSTKLEYLVTNNRKVFNIMHKELYSCCSFDGWHSGENKTYDKWYGTKTFWRDSKHKPVRYPSWKLVSKNKNQYDYKPITKWITSDIRYGSEYMEIEF